MSDAPNCYKCKWRKELDWSVHSKCTNPQINMLSVTGNKHGTKKGWFNWPGNFDPVWLESCDGFEAIVQPDEQEGGSDADA